MSDKINDRFGNPVPEFYTGYFLESGKEELVTLLSNNLIRTVKVISAIPQEKENFAYAEGKWTVKEVILHIIDGERIFAYRALSFARNDQTSLPGFDENDYVQFSGANERTMKSLIDEFKTVRESTIQLFMNFSTEMLSRMGTANEVGISVEAIGRSLAGHESHHIKVLQDRYL